MEKETLEEAAEKLYPKEGEDYTYGDLGLIQQDAFKFGAKWQQEQEKNKYSEEDMIDFAMFYYTHQGKATKYWGKDLFKEWFEQFKNK